MAPWPLLLSGPGLFRPDLSDREPREEIRKIEGKCGTLFFSAELFWSRGAGVRQGARWAARAGANGRRPYSACLKAPAPGCGDPPARREGLQGLRRRGPRVAQGPRRLWMVSHKVAWRRDEARPSGAEPGTCLPGDWRLVTVGQSASRDAATGAGRAIKGAETPAIRLRGGWFGARPRAWSRWLLTSAAKIKRGRAARSHRS